MSDFSINVALFSVKEENKKSDKSPDMRGSLEVPAEEVNALISYLQTAERVMNYNDTEVVKIEFAGWRRQSKKGETYLSGKLSAPYVHQAGQQRRDAALGSKPRRNDSLLQARLAGQVAFRVVRQALQVKTDWKTGLIPASQL